MCHIPRLDSSFYLFLLKIDEDTLLESKAAGCQFCGGKLDNSHFLRKPRGFPPEDFPDGFGLRFSVCCRREGCRKRLSPKSVRFMGRKVYLLFFILFSSSTSKSFHSDLCRLTGLSRQTLKRWRRFWEIEFVKTKFWKEAKSRFMPPLDEGFFPQSLLNQIGDPFSLKSKALQFLSPAFSSQGENNQMI